MAKLVADFEGVESGGGGGARVPEDDYRVKVVEAKVGESKSSGNPMIIWTFEIAKGKHKGKKLKKDYSTLTKESLWKLLSILEALGFNVPKKKVDLTPILKKAKGKECGVTVIDGEYEGKMQSRIADYMDLDTLESTEDEDTDDEDDEDESDDEDDDESDDDEDEEEEKSKKKAKKGKKKRKSSDDDDDEIEDLDLDEL